MNYGKITFLTLSALGIVGGLINQWNLEDIQRSLGLASVSSYLSNIFSLAGVIDFFLYPVFVAAIIGGIVGFVNWLKGKKSRGITED